MDSANAYLIKMIIVVVTLVHVIVTISSYLGISIEHEIALILGWTVYNLSLCILMGLMVNALLQAIMVWMTCHGYSEPSEKLVKLSLWIGLPLWNMAVSALLWFHGALPTSYYLLNGYVAMM